MIKIPKKKSEGKKGKGSKKKTGAKSKAKEAEKPDSTQSNGLGFGEGRVFELFNTTMDELAIAPKDIINNVLNPDTVSHLIRAGLEGYQAVQGISPAAGISEETIGHIRKAEREFLLAVRAVIDARIADLDKRIGEMPVCDPEVPEKVKTGLKEIKVKD